MKDKFNNEQWKMLSIPGLRNNESYAISDFGRLKSYKAHPSGKVVNSPKVRGYEVLVLKLDNDKTTTKYIHKLVAEHFIERDNDMQEYVIHKDFDKCNNHVSNLCWVTRATMFAHQKINPNYKRGVVRNAKLSETQVIRLKMKLLKSANKPSIIAKEFGITHTQLNRIKRGENWGHVKVG
jgi:hypothetical protein